MSVKRSISEVSCSMENNVSVKTVFTIEEIPEDMILMSKTLSTEEQIELVLEYDQIYSQFFIRAKKETEGGTKMIMLSLEMVKELLRQLQMAQTVIDRYEGSGKNVAFRFPLGNNVVMKVEESFGSMWIDIRRYFFLNNGEMPTKAGIKMRGENCQKLKSVLTSFNERVNQITPISEGIMLNSYLALLCKEIEVTYTLNSPYCEGCKIKSPSQKDHMEEGGCMGKYEEFSTKVDAHILEAYESVEMGEVKKLARKVSKMMNVPLLSLTLDDFTVGQLKLFIQDPQTETEESYVVARNLC